MKPSAFLVRHLLAAAAAATAACATVPGTTPLQSSASVNSPSVAVGESWTYRVHDGFTGFKRPTQDHRVAEVGSDRIQVMVSHEGLKDDIQVYDREWNWLKHPATNLQTFDYSPAYRALDFPLVPGKTWKTSLIATDPADGKRYEMWMEGRVVGWEKVKVPAGEFDALRIKRGVFFNYYVPTLRNYTQIVEEEWYAPAVKQAVRREARSWYLSYIASGPADQPVLAHQPSLRPAGFIYAGRDGNGGPKFVPDDWLIYELVSYSVR